MTNNVKNHETNLVSEKNASDVNAILEGVENVPFALSGATTKTILYALFSVLAAMELTSALGFYVASFKVSLMVSFVFCGMVAAMFHALLHSILSNTAHGIVFSKRSESSAMSTEVIANIVLSVVLLLGASCTVFFVGKKGFTAYRATEFETKTKVATPEKTAITPDMLTSKSGKISVYKLELLGKLEGAKAATKEAETTASDGEKERYDKTTDTITDIVGTSAFALEILLALLAFTIATAKKAAVMEEIARRKSTENNHNGQKIVNNRENTTVTVNRNDEINENRNGKEPKKFVTLDSENKPYPTIFPTDRPVTDNRKEEPTKRKGIGFMPENSNENIGTCPQCHNEFERKNPKKIYCSTNCKTQFWQSKNGVSLLGEPLK